MSTADARTRSRMALAGMLFGFQASQVLVAAAELGLADLIADESRTSDDLATATGTDPDALRRLLRAMAGLGQGLSCKSWRTPLRPYSPLAVSSSST